MRRTVLGHVLLAYSRTSPTTLVPLPSHPHAHIKNTKVPVQGSKQRLLEQSLDFRVCEKFARTSTGDHGCGVGVSLPPLMWYRMFHSRFHLFLRHIGEFGRAIVAVGRCTCG
ncbi:hypothetical protein BDQ17DRAFT_1369568 [Cyathus striatus]|nr:hypothetical protein BDQ17DRAFT_1369568 [Cyathus striatus]